MSNHHIVNFKYITTFFNKSGRKIESISSSDPYSSLGLPDKNRGCLAKFEFQIKQQKNF